MDNEKNYFLNKENSDYTSEILKRVIDLGISFQIKDNFIKKYTKYDIISLVDEYIPESGTNLEDLISYFNENLIGYCINQANKNYISFPDAGNSISGYVADILKPLLNQNLIADIRSAPLGTYLEITLIKWIRKLVGFDVGGYPKNIGEIGGVYCFGGVISVVTGLLIARSKIFEKSFINGLKNTENIYVICPEGISHYSVNLAMGYLGFGAKNVIEIPLKSDFKMDENKLENCINNILNKGGRILSIIAYAGDSRTMRIDNLNSIADIAEKYNIWLHVDACHGGQLLFSKKQRNKINGIERADSITLDPHKVLSVTYPSSLVLFKNPKDLLTTAKNYDMTIEEGTLDLGQISPFIGSKSFESLKLWFLIKNLGLEGLSEMVDKRYNLVKYFFYLISGNENFYSLHDVNINSLCFIYYPKKLKTKFENENNIDFKNNILKIVDKINKEIQENLYNNGILSIHSFKLNDEGNKIGLKGFGKRQVLGIIIGNNNINNEDILSAYNKIIEVSNNIKYE